MTYPRPAAHADVGGGAAALNGRVFSRQAFSAFFAFFAARFSLRVFCGSFLELFFVSLSCDFATVNPPFGVAWPPGSGTGPGYPRRAWRRKRSVHLCPGRADSMPRRPAVAGNCPELATGVPEGLAGAIGGGHEGILPAVTATRQMIDRSGDLQPQWTCHGRSLPGGVLGDKT